LSHRLFIGGGVEFKGECVRVLGLLVAVPISQAHRDFAALKLLVTSY